MMKADPKKSLINCCIFYFFHEVVLGGVSLFPEGSMVAMVFLRSMSTWFSRTFCRIRFALCCRLATTCPRASIKETVSRDFKH